MPGFSLTGGVVMGFRFRQSIRLAPGLRINLGKRGASLSVGRPGATVNIGKKGVRTTVGVPGSGMSYTFGGAGGRKRPTGRRGVGGPPPEHDWKNGVLGFLMLFGVGLIIFSDHKLVGGLMVGIPLAIIVRAAMREGAGKKADEARALSAALFDASPQALAEADAIAPPRAAPVGRDKVELPEKDNWEVSGASGGRMPVHVDLEIAYVDGQGQASRRRITTRCIEDFLDGGDAIHAFCHERKAMRTFLVSRIREMIDLETGEVVDDPAMFFRRRYADSPEGRVAAALAVFDDELVATMYVARADGRLVKKERDHITAFIEARSGQNLDFALLDREIRLFNPSHRDFALAIAALKTRPLERRQEVVALSQAIIECEKRIDPMEAAAVEKLRAALLSA